MKKLIFAMVFISTSLFANSKLFQGEWDFSSADIISVIMTKDSKKWVQVSCSRDEYLNTKKCLKPHNDTVPTYYVFDEKMGGLCSIKTTRDSYCWLLLTVYKKGNGIDMLITKADPFNSEPGLGYAISAYRLKR